MVQQFADAAASIDRGDLLTPSFVVTLPADVWFLGRLILGSKLFIRRCYVSLLKKLNDFFSAPSAPGINSVAILGTPGIGKSFFGIYFLITLLQEKSAPSIVYQVNDGANCLFFLQDGAYKVCVETALNHKVLAHLSLPSTYYICDSCAPSQAPGTNCRTLLTVTSLNQMYAEFKKSGCRSFYMPLWDDNELELCRSLVFPYVTREQYKDLVGTWGLVPRYVLRFATLSDIQTEEYRHAIGKAHAVIDDIIAAQAAGTAEIPFGIVHRLLHLEVNPETFQFMHLKFASQKIAVDVARKSVEKNRANTIRFVRDHAHDPTYSHVLGYFWEHLAHLGLVASSK